MNLGSQQTFRALADPTRRQILMFLKKDSMTLGEIAGHFDMTRAAVKKHLVMLEEGLLITSRAEGRERIHELQPAGLKSAIEWLGYFDQFWDERLASFKTAIESETGEQE
ncbi:metalloregulator ArsR/SmtB family transcription factor [Roseibium sp.]|uniref:ArsR/SmtB family transcription factor n=1 Tax=Roseibium sp. TaxID=1936156 RepID=UPI0032670380